MHTNTSRQKLINCLNDYTPSAVDSTGGWAIYTWYYTLGQSRVASLVTGLVRKLEW